MSAPADVEQDLRGLRPRWLESFDANDYAITRFVFLRMLGLIYTVAFLVASNQLVPLVGSEGLEPADRFLDAVRTSLGAGNAFVRLPTLFWFGVSDAALTPFRTRASSWRSSFCSGSPTRSCSFSFGFCTCRS